MAHRVISLHRKYLAAIGALRTCRDGALASSPLSRQSIVNWGGATWATRHVPAKPMPKVTDYYFMIVGVIVGSFAVAISFGIPVARWLLQ
jgi:hypothetical protein